MQITLKQLVEAGACHNQVCLFRRYFGQGGTVTLELCLDHAGEFDLDWAVRNLLSGPAQDAYEAVMKPARDAYNAVIKPDDDAYDAATRSAWDAYDAVIKLAQDAYNAAKARAFYAASKL